jgi:hypothetical protein
VNLKGKGLISVRICYIFHMLALSRPEFFAFLGIMVSIIRYGTYIRSIFKGKTTPHVFSWLNWGIIVGIGAYAQFKLGGGPSAVVLCVVSSVCLLIAFIALFRGEKNITRTDWMAFTGALLAVPVWLATDNPVYAVLVLILIDMLSYYPTIRKSWHNPWGEPPGSYFWAGLRYFFALFAVPVFSPSNLFYPAFLMTGDWAFMLYVIWRRKRLRPAASPASSQP